MSTSLHIIIIGGGICGLSLALGLRRHGHQNVEVFESSSFLRENGAGIAVGPNAHNLLRQWGVDLMEHGAVDGDSFTEYDGKTLDLLEGGAVAKSAGHGAPLAMLYRVDLHNALKQAVLSPDGDGEPAVIHLGSRIEHVDTGTAEIRLSDGQCVKGDVIFAADGVHSVARSFVAGNDIKPFPFGKSILRFLLRTEDLECNPRMRKLAEMGCSRICLTKLPSEGKLMVFYAFRGGTMMNAGAIYPDPRTEKEIPRDTWNTMGTKSELLELYRNYHPDIIEMCGMANYDEIRMQVLLDMDKLPTMVKEKTALIGDAAHPFLPFSGQGAAQGIEDAAALVGLFPANTKPSEAEERLNLYMKCRYERVHKVQHKCREIGKQKAIMDDEFTEYIYSHDALLNAQSVLARSISERWKI